jgi:ATP-dependent RNA helicase DDX10/DBP4
MSAASRQSSHRQKRPKRALQQPSTTTSSSSSSSKAVVDRKMEREQEIANLTQRIQDEAPRVARGSSFAATTAPRQSNAVTAFASLPLSRATQRGLLEASFTTLTAIQAACLPHALAGRDVLGAARTGSGKTLAFVIPIMELLFRQQFTPTDGPAAIVLSPTRELAMQIFGVIQTVGRHHVFSVGLLIGGKKDFFLEQQNIGTTNIIVATPGRLLQHLEQTAHLDMSELQILVLDEADRILDMGFRNQLLRVLEYLPQNEQRQTMLFSATQTRDVQSLAALSLQSPEYLGVHDAEKTETPDLLQQSYVVVPVEHKLNAIFSFIKSHLHCKCIIFLSTCAQVRHAHDLLCHLRPGVPVMALHGKLSQERRTQIFLDLMQRSAAVLLATDLAARGLDFPKIDWVVQADAPEDAAMYIHRAGRTARYRSVGKSLLMVTPGEEKRGFIDLILRGGGEAAASGVPANEKANTAQKVPLKKLSINPTKATIVTDRAASLVASNPPLNVLAKKAFQSYIRSITLMPHKHIFDVQDLNLDGYAKSLGLAATPNLRFLEKAAADRTEFRDKKNVNKKLQRLKEQIKMEKLQKKIERLGGKLPEPDPTTHSTSMDDHESDDELLVPKSRLSADDNASLDGTEDLPLVNVNQVTQSRKLKKIRVDGRIGSASQRTVFDEDGAPVQAVLATIPTSVPRDTLTIEEARSSYLEAVRARLTSTKEQDVADQKDRIRLKHKKRRLAEKGDLEDSPNLPTAVLQSSDHGDDHDTDTNETDGDDDTDSSSVASSDDGHVADLHRQEDLALALIRGN